MSEWYIDNAHIGFASCMQSILSNPTLVPTLGFKGLTVPPIQSEACSGAVLGSMHLGFFTSNFFDYISVSPMPNNSDQLCICLTVWVHPLHLPKYFLEIKDRP